MIPADSIICDNNTIMSNESALTGESDDLKKAKAKDCFLLSSCLITEGEEARALVIGIGPNSQWGKIKANLVSEAVNTPLQDKLELMAQQVIWVPIYPLIFLDWIYRIILCLRNFCCHGDLDLGSASWKKYFRWIY